MKPLIINTIRQIRIVMTPLNLVVSVAVLLLAIYCNYFAGIKLWPGVYSRYTFFQLLILFFSFSAAGALLVYNQPELRKADVQKLILFLLLSSAMFATKISLPFYQLLNHFSPSLQQAFHQPASWMGGVVFISAAILLYHKWDHQSWGLYFTKKPGSFSPYLLLLLMMVPLLFFAAAQPDFQLVYPRSKVLQIIDQPHWYHYSLFELSYALDFITIELFFRGFLLAVLSRWLGTRAVLPVALFYFSIHLGKPMLEAFSSFWGGLILGSISIQTKSIWGGWMVHVGIALLMELLGKLI
ncbi:MAG: CPBP family intramembrane glutamic endopeptidase [Chitinophagaceae bacterium]